MKPDPKHLMGDIIIAQACIVALRCAAIDAVSYAKHHGKDTMPAFRRLQTATNTISQVEQMRYLHSRYRPSLKKLDGWQSILQDQ